MTIYILKILRNRKQLKLNKMMQAKTQKLLGKLLLLPEYERNQIMSCLIASMLSEVSHNKAKETYNNIIKELQYDC